MEVKENSFGPLKLILFCEKKNKNSVVFDIEK